MRNFKISLLAAMAGLFFLTLSAVSTFMTVADGDYRVPLLVGLLSSVLALTCLSIPIFRGPLIWRLVAIGLSLPLLGIFAEFCRRAPGVFGGRR